MKTIDYLEKQYEQAFDMIKFGETKNTALIAFNGAIIIGLTKLANDVDSNYVFYFLIYAITMCAVSIFISFSAMIAKIGESNHNIALPRNYNLLFFATIAHMNHEELIEKIKKEYGCEGSNEVHEKDLAKQAIITSQIAVRKFKLFNTAIAFTLSGLLTPLSLIIYKLYLAHEK